MRRHLRTLVSLLGLCAINLFTHAPASAAKYTHWWLPEDISTFGPQIDRMFYYILAITGVVFLLVQGTLALFLVRYRYKKNRRGTFIHGNHTVEVIWTIIPSLILLWLALYQQRAWSEIKQQFPAEKDAYVVEASGQQFEWHFKYPGPDGAFQTGDDIETINQLHVPVNKPVLLKISSKDVIHSFFLPELRLKQDAVPGLIVPSWFQAIKTGTYDIACAELCGLGHYRMRGFLNVYNQPELDQKLTELAQPKPAAEDVWW